MPQDNNLVLIKKYANRRLYNMAESSYITIEDVAEMVRQNVKFKVIDAKTEADLTRVTLTQIILDQEIKGYNMVPIELLMQIVKFCHHPANKAFAEHLANNLKMFEENMNNMQNMYDDFIKNSNIDNNSFIKASEENMKLFSDMMKKFTNLDNNGK